MRATDTNKDGEAGNIDSAGSSSVVVAAVVERAPNLAVAEDSLTSSASAASSLSPEKEAAPPPAPQPSTLSTPRPLTFSTSGDVIQTMCSSEGGLEFEETKL